MITLVKLSGKNFDLDLMFTKHIKNYIQNDFDFGICMIEKSYLINGDKVNVKEFEENIIKGDLFIEDEKNKTFTFRHNGKSEKDIERSFMGHLTRLQEKYQFNVKVEIPLINEESKATFSYANYIWVKSVCENKKIIKNRKLLKI